jgi:hypothetical protein
LFLAPFTICLDTMGTKRAHGRAAGQGLWMQLQLPTRQFLFADTSTWSVPADFPGDVCDETDLHRGYVCDIRGAADAGLIGHRRAQDGEPVQC